MDKNSPPASALTPARALLVVAACALLFGLSLRGTPSPPPLPPCPDPALKDGRLICDAAAHAAAHPTAALQPIGDHAWLLGRKLDVNQASKLSLARIPGVGPSLAGRIVQAREERGRFQSLAELDEVQGVGPKMLSKLSRYVEVVP
jgi:competence protein ComEA